MIDREQDLPTATEAHAVRIGKPEPAQSGGPTHRVPSCGG
jgi:hypothetical protein